MPRYPIPWDTTQYYYLIPFLLDGTERPESGSLLSNTIVQDLETTGFTDVFILSHGWKFDEGKAKVLYEDWMGVMHAKEVSDDVKKARGREHGFKPLIVCIYWPSQAWDRDEYLPDPLTSPVQPPLPSNPEEQVAHQVKKYAAAISSTPAAQNALQKILEYAQKTEIQETLPQDVVASYKTVYEQSGLGNLSGSDQPGADHGVFDPQAVVVKAQALSRPDQQRLGTSTPPTQHGLASIFDEVGQKILLPLRQLSFWTMKARARVVGETGCHALLVRLIKALGDNHTPFHLMGHSFGCIVVSAMITGTTDKDKATPCKVNSLFLAQGALSLWSYADHVYRPEGPRGHYNLIFNQKLVQGCVVTTRSANDLAVGEWFPRGEEVDPEATEEADPGRSSIPGSKYPRYGGVGAYGIQGLKGDILEDEPMKPANEAYSFAANKVYNLNGSNVIKEMERFSGAHNDIIHPEVAHAFWSAVLLNT